MKHSFVKFQIDAGPIDKGEAYFIIKKESILAYKQGEANLSFDTKEHILFLHMAWYYF